MMGNQTEFGNDRKIRLRVTNPIILEYDGQSVVFLHPDRATWLKTSATGKWIYQLLSNGGYSASDVVQRCSERYSLPQGAIVDSVSDLLHNLHIEGFIEIEGNGTAERRENRETLLSDGGLLPDDLPQHGLISVWLNLLGQCNLACSHCFLPPHHNSQPMSLQGARRVLDILADQGVKRLYLSGGEPLIHPELFEIASYARSVATWSIFLVTNGCTDDKTLLQRLATTVDYVQVSLDGIDAKTNDEIRGLGSFAKASNTITILQQAGGSEVGISFTPHPANIHQMAELPEYALSLGVKFVHVTRPKLANRNALTADPRIREMESLEFRKRIFESYDAMISRLHTISSTLAAVRDVKIPVIAPGFDPAINLLVCSKRGSCGAGSAVLHVDEHGDCYPCTGLTRPDLRLGNLFTEPFETVYGLRSVREFRQRIHIERIGECKQCAFKHFCAGDCRALGTDVTQPSPFCGLIKERYERFLRRVYFRRFYSAE